MLLQVWSKVCYVKQVRLEMYKKYFNTIGLAIIIPIIFLYAFQQGVSLAYNYWLSMWADDPIINGTQIDTDLKLTVFGALGFVQGRFSNTLILKSRLLVF